MWKRDADVSGPHFRPVKYIQYYSMCAKNACVKPFVAADKAARTLINSLMRHWLDLKSVEMVK